MAESKDQDHSQAERTPPTPDAAIASAPFLRVVRGDASPEELAALVATLSAVAAARSGVTDEAKQRPVIPNWSSRARQLRTPVYPSAGGWRRSALP